MWDPARSTWDAQALLLLHAFQFYDDSLCSGCGQSALHALEVRNTREFRIDTVTCLGCNVRETWDENNGKERTKGEKAYVINTMGEGGGDDG